MTLRWTNDSDRVYSLEYAKAMARGEQRGKSQNVISKSEMKTSAPHNHGFRQAHTRPPSGLPYGYEESCGVAELFSSPRFILIGYFSMLPTAYCGIRSLHC